MNIGNIFGANTVTELHGLIAPGSLEEKLFAKRR